MPQSIGHIRSTVPLLLDEARENLPGMFVDPTDCFRRSSSDGNVKCY
ncbi:hypothetical protein THIX_60605 [Thiomonas sp. X19]|nr:hypothetical protein THIX_60605 [Thiomonas sp. X19]